MKKYLLALFVILFIAGCGKNELKTTKCTLSSNDVVNGYKTSATYEINHKNDLVESVKTIETVESDNEVFLSTMENTLNTTYSTMNNNYGGYDFKVEKNGNKVTSTTTIDYNKMNIEKFISENTALKPYVKDSKLTLEGIKLLYTSIGASCE